MAKLIALYPILYLAKQYSVGDELPANDDQMVAAWLDAKTAVWQEDEPPKAKAKAATARAGLPGSAVGSETDDNLVGVVPQTPARKKA